MALASTPKRAQQALERAEANFCTLVEHCPDAIFAQRGPIDQVRTLVRGILRRQGYRVLEARTPAEAIGISAQHDAPIDLLLTDVVMSQMSGRKLADVLLPQRPNMRVLYVSGYTDDTIIHHGVLDAEITFLQKPLTPAVLLRKLREVLDMRKG